MSDTSQRGKRKHRRSEAEWREIISDYKRSGLTQEAFCQQAAIPKSSFYKWHKRLEQNATPVDPAPFVDLNTLVHPKPPGSWEVDLDLGNGMRLSVRGG